MRTRLLVAVAGVALFAAGVLIGALVLAGDASETAKQPRTTASFPSVPATAGYATQAVIAGVLNDGRPWTLRNDPDHGLCLIISTVDFGCDVPNTNPANPASPRKAVESNRFPTPQSGVLVYGFLPPDATNVVLVDRDGRTIPADPVVQPSSRVWAAPISPGQNPQTIAYRAANGAEVARFPLG